jgi:hypothetical protein
VTGCGQPILPLSARLSPAENRRRHRTNFRCQIRQAAARSRGVACPHGAEGERFLTLLLKGNVKFIRELVAVCRKELNITLSDIAMANDVLIKCDMFKLDLPVPVDENLEPLPGYPRPVYLRLASQIRG